MRIIKSFYLIVSLIVLMIVRPLAPGEWFGSIVWAGLLVAWLATLNRLLQVNSQLQNARFKARHAIVVIALSILGLVLLVFVIINLIFDIKWLNDPIVLDEVTLFALLVSLEQTTVINLFNKIIRKV